MDRQTDLNILLGSEVFRSLGDDVLDEALRLAFRKRLAKDEVLYHQGDAVTTFYILVVGRLRVSQTTVDGGRITARYLGAGEMVGYSVLAGGEAQPGTVSAIEDSYLLGWSEKAIRALMAQHPQIAVNALGALGLRYQEAQTRLQELSTETVERRIAHALLRLSRQAGRRTAEGIEITIPLTRKDMAELTGTTLHTVSRTLSAWEREGIVSSAHRYVVVRRPQALTALDLADV
jgi:CRP-like cAMP-binding protein